MDYRETARRLLGDRQLLFTLGEGQGFRHDPALFGDFVAMAAEFGATHAMVGRTPFRYGTSFLPDNHDPYAAWCNTSLGLLWTFPPPTLREWIPEEEVRWRQETIAEQVAELRCHGLRGAIDGVEPMWLPEEVYRAHPAWRGAQCELGRIARRPYFAPSIDEPEVLALYREATHALCAMFPEIDQFAFLSNDSGAGIPWTPNTYPGMNGPLKWRRRDPGERIAGWLRAVQEGAADANVEARVRLHSTGLSAEINSATKRHLQAGLYLNHTAADSRPWSAADAFLGSGIWSPQYPAAGMADPAAFAAGLQNVYANPGADDYRVGISIDVTHLSRARDILEAHLREPGTGALQRTRTLLQVARDFTESETHAEAILGVWETVAKATHAVQQIRQKGFGLVLPFCGVSMRWIVRPLVPAPEKLTTDETAYYETFLYSVNDREDNANFSFVLGKPVFRGESVMWMSRWALEEAYSTLGACQAELNRIAAQLNGDAKARLQLEAARAGAYACLAKNAQNVIRYQYALDIAHHPQYGANVMDYDENIVYDQRALQLRKIAREELDNTQRLVELIESQSEPVIVHARNAEEESVFMLGPDPLGDLRRKMDIMMDHWQDYESLYPSTKVWEFEPRSREELEWGI